MTSFPDDPDGRQPDPDSVDAAFEEIVSRLTAELADPAVRSWPEVEDADEGRQRPDDAAPPSAPRPAQGLGAPRRDWAEWDDLRLPAADPDPPELGGLGDAEADEGHYVPPEPEPVPRGDSRIRWAWAGAVGAPVLAIVLPLLGWPLDGLTGVALVGAFLLGFGYLVSRLRDEPDDGMVV